MQVLKIPLVKDAEIVKFKILEKCNSKPTKKPSYKIFR